MTRIGEVRVCGAGEIFASRDAVLFLAKAAQAQAVSLRVGGRVDIDVERWTDALLEAAHRTLSGASASDIGRSELPIGEVCASVAMLDPVDTRQAARLLGGTTSRNVVDLIARKAFPSARQVAGRWQIERAEVLARAERTS